MRKRYKVILIAACAYFGAFSAPVTASNVYCDFIAHDTCTTRIVGVSPPPFNIIPLNLPDYIECIFEGKDGMMEPCHMEVGYYFAWPFPHMMRGESGCDLMCPDRAYNQSGTVFPGPANSDITAAHDAGREGGVRLAP